MWISASGRPKPWGLGWGHLLRSSSSWICGHFWSLFFCLKKMNLYQDFRQVSEKIHSILQTHHKSIEQPGMCGAREWDQYKRVESKHEGQVFLSAFHLSRLKPSRKEERWIYPTVDSRLPENPTQCNCHFKSVWPEVQTHCVDSLLVISWVCCLRWVFLQLKECGRIYVHLYLPSNHIQCNSQNDVL